MKLGGIRFWHGWNVPPLPFSKLYCTFLYNPPNFFIALESWASRHVIQFLNLISKHSHHQCSDPSVLKKGIWDSALAWMKCSATALFKTALHFFIQPHQILFYCFKVGQEEMLYNF